MIHIRIFNFFFYVTAIIMVTGQNGIDKMVLTKWHGQNGRNFYTFQLNWIEYIFSNHKLQISDKLV